jgi:hypothetical protein
MKTQQYNTRMEPRVSMNVHRRVLGFGWAATLALSVHAIAQTTVGELHPNPNALTIQDSPANTAHPNFMTKAAMATAVASAYNSNEGGVINWDTSAGWVNGTNANSFDVTYGTHANRILTLTRGDAGVTFGATQNGASPTTSGDMMVGVQNSGSPLVLTFSKGLLAWGITQLNRFSSRDVVMSFTLEDGTVIT